jgi:hypothetical protein
MAFERIANAETTFLKSSLVTKGLAWWYEKAADLVLNGLVVSCDSRGKACGAIPSGRGLRALRSALDLGGKPHRGLVARS